jgi:bacterioferritin-associated ferredoxin
MIVCSCNVLSDRDVRSAIKAERTLSTSRVYGCLGCSAKCGGCARTIRHIMDEALGRARYPATAARSLLPESTAAGRLSRSTDHLLGSGSN